MVIRSFHPKMTILGILFLFHPIVSSATPYAIDPYEVDHDIGVVQKKRFDPVGRLIINIYGGLNPFHSLLSDFQAGLGAQYNFLHWLGIDLRGYKHFTDAKSLFDEAREKVDPNRQDQFFLNFIDTEFSAHLVWIPFYGKQHLWALSDFHFLIYMVVGASFLSFKKNEDTDETPKSTAGLSLGLGMHVHLSNLFHLNFELRDILYTDQSFNQDRFQNYVMVQLSIGITLPSFDDPQRKI